MKKLLPIIIVLLIVCLLPGFVGASESGNGTGIFALDLVIFVAVPFIVIVFLMLFLFKLPSEISAPSARAKAPARVAPKKETLAYEPDEISFEEMKPAEPEITCPECGGIVTMTDPACPHCGAKFEDEATAEEAEKVPAVEPTPEIPAEPEPIDELELVEPEPILDISEPKGREDAKDFGLKCPTCGGNIGLEEKVCPHCGANFEEKTSGKTDIDTSEEELDALLGIAPEEKAESVPEQKPAQEKPSDITISFEEAVEEAPAPKKKGKKKR
jgi:uncharacterized OB-fold protein